METRREFQEGDIVTVVPHDFATKSFSEDRCIRYWMEQQEELTVRRYRFGGTCVEVYGMGYYGHINYWPIRTEYLVHVDDSYLLNQI